MAAARRFEELEAWRSARQVTQTVYRISGQAEFRRDFGLQAQIRRAAVSVMANIAEGFERRGPREFARFLAIAKSSAGELESHLWVALDLGYLSPDEFASSRNQVARAKRQIASLLRYLATSNKAKPEPRT